MAATDDSDTGKGNAQIEQNAQCCQTNETFSYTWYLKTLPYFQKPYPANSK